MDHGEQEVATSSIPLKDIQFTAEGKSLSPFSGHLSAQLGLQIVTFSNFALPSRSLRQGQGRYRARIDGRRPHVAAMRRTRSYRCRG